MLFRSHAWSGDQHDSYLSLDTSTATFTVSNSSNNPPPVPSTLSPSAYSGWVGTSYGIYTTTLYPDPDGHQVKAVFDWGDGIFSESGLITPAVGGTSVSGTHSWTTAGVYSLKVKAVDSLGLASNWSSAASMTIGVPSNPASNLTATVSGSNVTLNWVDNSNDEAGFKMYRGPVWTDIGNVGANVTNHTVSGLANGTYDFKVQAYNLSGGGSYPIYSNVSNVVTVTIGSTASPTPTPTPTPSSTLSAPTSVSAYLGTGKIIVVWPSGTAPKYNVYKCVVDYGCGGALAYGYVYTVLTAYYEDYSVTPGSTYSYKITACDSNNSNCSGGTISNSVTYSSSSPTPTPTPTPTASPSPSPVPSGIPAGPSNFYAYVYDNNRVNMYWTDNSTNESEFKISRRIVGGIWYYIKTLAANIISYVDTGLSDGSYEYDVIACNSYGCSAFSNSATVTIGGTLVSPSPSPTYSPTPTPTPTPTPIPVPSISGTITGVVLFSNGEAVTDAEVGAYSKETGQWVSVFTDTGGRYSLIVSGGRFQIGVRPRDPLTAKWTYTGQFIDVELTQNGEIKTVNITIPISDTKLIVTVIDSNGSPLTNVGVVVDTISAASLTSGQTATGFFGKTDGSGTANFNLRPGTYYVRGFLPYESGYIPSSEQSVTINSGETKNVKLVFVKRETAVSISIKGVVRLPDGTPTDAFIWAWSEKGRSVEARAGFDGQFILQVSPSDRWHIGAGKLLDQVPYKSSEIFIQVENSAVSVEIVMSKFAEFFQSAAVTQPADRKSVV